MKNTIALSFVSERGGKRYKYIYKLFIVAERNTGRINKRTPTKQLIIKMIVYRRKNRAEGQWQKQKEAKFSKSHDVVLTLESNNYFTH